ncbi:nucleolar complex protein 14 [Exophiala xenobiotica]|uniref:Nucleolar complex protein 14 n=1 Tax=Lithohypha guttulata TaxID=1690604 RepID=A0ABR0K587_9EURO|nr:nucleolar complex protein 14 [Lithohypha guttulata]KAK5313231.1 nucleolar complex protein 14 [Exophiala xenobiotica]
MPPSQLKQLKTSLRDNGILGPQKSKKLKKANSKDAHKRSQRNAALEGIRERFNPFEAKAPARREKFDIASNKPTKKTVERPGVTRGLGEERRRETLLKEMQSRNKVGGMLDRRFGEDDPNMTPEQKAAERFAQQALRSSKKNSMFNLEEDSDEELHLTHGGRALDLAGDVPVRDDFDEELSGSETAEFDAQDDRPRKRVRLEDGDEENEEEDEVPQRKKTKNEVMQEVIAKSKAYKAARQAQKEDDEDLRAELDKGLGDIFAAMGNQKTIHKQLPSPPLTDSEPRLDPSRAAMLAGKSREEAEKEYEANIRQMQLDARSKPTFRTKTEEEKAAEDKARLDDLERKRLRRMKGEVESSEDEEEQEGADIDKSDDEEPDDAEAFGLDQPGPRYIPDLAVEDEDEFVMDDIIASDTDPDADADAASDFEDNDESSLEEPEDDGDDDFINGLVLPKHPATVTKSTSTAPPAAAKALPFTFACPQDLQGLIEETAKLSADGLPTAVQRIRALYHKGLAEGNEDRLGKFSQALIFWIAALVNHETPQKPSMQIIEQLLRHVHSMAKTQPHDVAAGFREYFRQMFQEDRKSLDVGDLVVLTGVSTIFPTSDQWHTVVTPSMLVLGKYLGQAPMNDLVELAKGVYACSLALRYQAISKRYVPEVITFICKAIRLLLPNDGIASVPKCTTPTLMEESTCRITEKASKAPSSKLGFEDLRASDGSKRRHNLTSESLLLAVFNLVDTCVDNYSSKTAYPELISPIHHLTKQLSQPSVLTLLHSTTRTTIKSLSSRLTSTLTASTTSRLPLTLHSHRPLAIKSSYPLFDSSYNPTRKQRDPDADRAELNKLKAEHKKERKGAMRELRKDANFVAREQLREKKAKDEAYEKKFKRLVAEIQGEEGREAKDYEREKAKRTRKGRF